MNYIYNITKDTFKKIKIGSKEEKLIKRLNKNMDKKFSYEELQNIILEETNEKGVDGFLQFMASVLTDAGYRSKLYLVKGDKLGEAVFKIITDTEPTIEELKDYSIEIFGDYDIMEDFDEFIKAMYDIGELEYITEINDECFIVKLK